MGDTSPRTRLSCCKVGSDIPHDDHIEMSGERMAFVLRWGIDPNGAFRQERSLVFPATHCAQRHPRQPDVPHGDGYSLAAGRQWPCLAGRACGTGVRRWCADGAGPLGKAGEMNVGSGRIRNRYLSWR